MILTLLLLPLSFLLAVLLLGSSQFRPFFDRSWLTVRRTSPQKDRPTAYEPSRQEKVPGSSGDQSVAMFGVAFCTVHRA